MTQKEMDIETRVSVIEEIIKRVERTVLKIENKLDSIGQVYVTQKQLAETTKAISENKADLKALKDKYDSLLWKVAGISGALSTAMPFVMQLFDK